MTVEDGLALGPEASRGFRGVAKELATRVSATVGLHRVFTTPQENSLTCVLYHRFFFSDETLEQGRTRLRRQCEWIRERFRPLRASSAVDQWRRGCLPPLPIVVTVDDAKCDATEACAIFEEFEIPVTVFVCVGWTDNAEPSLDSSTLARLIDHLRWYAGPSRVLDLDGETVMLDGRGAEALIDRVLCHPRVAEPDFHALLWDQLKPHHPKPEQRFSTWSDLAGMNRDYVEFGSHTVTHYPLASATDVRLRFELGESMRVIRERTGECSLFSYPYGRPGTWSERTSRFVREAGYSCAFLTSHGFAAPGQDPFELPRIVVPNRRIGAPYYRALLSGGDIPFSGVRRR